MPIIRPVIDALGQDLDLDFFQKRPSGRRSVTNPPVEEITIMDDHLGGKAVLKREDLQNLTAEGVQNMLQERKLSCGADMGLLLVPDASRDGTLCFRIVPLPDKIQSCGIRPSLSRPRPSYPDSEDYDDKASSQLLICSAFRDVLGWDVHCPPPALDRGSAVATDPGIKKLRIYHRLFADRYITTTGSGVSGLVSVLDVVEALNEAFMDTRQVPELPATCTFDGFRPYHSDLGGLELFFIEDDSLSSSVHHHSQHHSGRINSQGLKWEPSSPGTRDYAQLQDRSLPRGYLKYEGNDDQPRARKQRNEYRPSSEEPWGGDQRFRRPYHGNSSY